MRRNDTVLLYRKGLLLLLMTFFLPEIFIPDDEIDTTGTSDQIEFSENSSQTPPRFKGGNTAFNQYLKEHLKYPEKAYAEEREGLVLVSCSIKADGVVSDARIFHTSDPDMGSEAVRLVESTTGLWFPAKQNGQEVAALQYVPVPFHLDKVQMPEVNGNAGNRELIKYIVAALLFVVVLFYLKKNDKVN